MGSKTDSVEVRGDLVMLFICLLLVNSDRRLPELLDKLGLHPDPGLVVRGLPVHLLQHLLQTVPDLPAENPVWDPTANKEPPKHLHH